MTTTTCFQQAAHLRHFGRWVHACRHLGFLPVMRTEVLTIAPEWLINSKRITSPARRSREVAKGASFNHMLNETFPANVPSKITFSGTNGCVTTWSALVTS
ncbi:MAG TPA: hypothetical protein DCX12_01580 [Chloroflexi bacterium]|nr:hypothetical protein [Chloroflexota bacterium]